MIQQYPNAYLPNACLDRGPEGGYQWEPAYFWVWKWHTPELGSASTPHAGRYITIQPRSSAARDQRMLLPITKKRKGNNKYGQSGSHRCQRCQKGKRKCVYSNRNESCVRCVERGFDDCGEKLPTPRKQAAQRQLQESGYCKDSDDSSSSTCFSPVSGSVGYPFGRDSLLPRLENIDTPRPLSGPRPEDEALCKLWNNLSI